MSFGETSNTMAKKLIHKTVDIYKYPDSLDSNSGEVTIGDLHGNAVKFLHFLLRHQVVKFKNEKEEKQLFNEFVNLYEKSDEIAICYLNMKPIELRINDHTQKLQEAKNRLDELSNLAERSEVEEQELALLNGPIGMYGSLLYKEKILNNQIASLNEEKDKLAALGIALKDIPVMLDAIIDQLEVVSNDTLVRLIGDELADRGSNDYITLKLLGFLHDNNVKVNITISNHSNEFIRSYEALNYQRPTGAIEGKDQRSFGGLKLLIDNNVVSKDEVTKLVDKAYKPTLKVIDYTLSNEGISLFSHAPVRFDRIKIIAERMNIVYNDSTKEALATTIDKINTRFDQIVKNNQVHEFCATAGVKVGDMSLDEISRLPLVDIIWNRWDASKDTDDARPSKINNYSVNYVHGHDPYQSKFEHVINLDTTSGKGMRSEQNEKVKAAHEVIANKSEGWEYAQAYLDGINEYKVLDSNERGLEQKHSLNLINEEYRQSKLMSPGKRTGIMTGIFGAIGLGVGAAIGAALVATGVFAPFGAGVLGVVALAAVSGVGAGIVSGSLGFGIAKATAPTPVNSTVVIPKNTSANTQSKVHSDIMSNQKGDSLSVLRKLGGTAKHKMEEEKPNIVNIKEIDKPVVVSNPVIVPVEKDDNTLDYNNSPGL